MVVEQSRRRHSNLLGRTIEFANQRMPQRLDHSASGGPLFVTRRARSFSLTKIPINISHGTPLLPKSFCKAILQSCQEASEDWGDEPLEPSAGISYMVATVATGSIANRLGVNIESDLEDLHKLLKRSTEKRPSSKVLQSIREYFPAWQPTSGDSCVPERYT